MDKELLNYIAEHRMGNTPPAVIRFNLHSMGKWPDEVIDQAMLISNQETSAGSVSPVIPPVNSAAFVPPSVAPSVTPPIAPSITPPVPPPTLGSVPPPISQNFGIPADHFSDTPPATAPVSRNRMGLKLAVGALVILVALGGGYFAYSKIGLFNSGLYTEDNLISALVSKYSTITTATYTTSFSLNMVPREAGAKPFLSGSPDDYEGSQSMLSSLIESVNYLSPEMRASLSFSLRTDQKDKETIDWSANVSADGDFGDLIYKVNVDGLKKGEDTYFKINNMPSLFFDISALKGQWIRIGDSGWGGSMSSMFGMPLSEEELDGEISAEDDEEWSNFLQRAGFLADQERLIVFRNSPKKDTIDGRSLTRYDLKIRKEAILPVYQKLQSEFQNSSDVTVAGLFDDPDFIEYLSGNEFSEVFDYYDKNASLLVWVDSKGYPAIVEYRIKVVPPDTATQLAEKQAEISLKIEISDINKPVIIEAPKDSKTFEEAMQMTMLGESFTGAANKAGDARVKAQLSSFRAVAEIYYSNSYSNGFGNYGETTNSCSFGMFGDVESGAAEYINPKNFPSGTLLSCRSNGYSYAVSASLNNKGEFWCIDSAGSSKLITNNLKPGETSCN